MDRAFPRAASVPEKPESIPASTRRVLRPDPAELAFPEKAETVLLVGRPGAPSATWGTRWA